MPRISVVVPVYKVEKYIHRCIDSILRQNYQDFELILVDDGSPDNCGSICDEYMEKDDRVHVIHQENGGLSAARNAGIDWVFANSDSQWLTFVDSDDWIHPEMLSVLLAAAVENNANVSICGFQDISGETPDISQEQYETRLWTPEAFFISHNVNAVIACAKLYSRMCFEVIRYPVGKIHEDEYTTYKILFAETQVAVTDAKLYYYFQNLTGITKGNWNPRRLDAVQALEEQIRYFAKNGFDDAYKQTVLDYAVKIRSNWHKVDQWHGPAEEKKEYFKDLKNRQKKAAWAYRHIYLQYGRDIYMDAFPHLMVIYSRTKVLLLRLKNRA